MLDLDVSFSKYDYFVILIPGVLILILSLLVVPEHIFIEFGQILDSWGSLQFAFIFLISVGLIIISYLFGLILSGLSSWLVEEQITGKWLSPQATNLFQLEKTKGKKRFKRYRQPYSEQFQKKFFEVFDEYFSGIDHEETNDLFRLCYHVVKEKCPNGYKRLGTFISLYGLYRSLIVAFLIGFILYLINVLLTWNVFTLLLMICFPFLIIFCFYKFLTYYRIFADEVFSSFYVYVLDLKKNQ
ncbi:MAG: hypothetical protein ACFFBP_01875 [Promethearchaeota archaeon]